MNQDLYNEMVAVMLKVQQSTLIPQRCLYTMLNLLKKSHAHFYSCFEQILNMILLENTKKETIYINKCIDFYTSFCAFPEVIDYCEQNSLELLHEKVLIFLLDIHNLESDTIRFRVCKIISKLLTLLIDVDLYEDLFDNLKSNMLERLIDSKSEIRLQAINCTFRLQDPSDKCCPILLMFLKRMSSDLMPKVRKACVEKIALRKDVFEALLLRIRDVNVDVRLATYTRMLNLVKFLLIKERLSVLKNGIYDGSEQVKLFVKNELVKTWLKEYDYNYLDFLKALRLDSNADDIKLSVEIIEFVLDSLFRTQSGQDLLDVINLTNNSVIIYKELNWESAIYWRFLVNTCRNSQALEPFLENLLPDLVDLVKYIKGYCIVKGGDGSSKEFQFILKQLLMITCEYDLVDISSRQALNQLINDVLCNYNLDKDVVEVVIKNMERSVPNDEQRERFLLEIISDVTCPIVVDMPENDVIGQIMDLKLRVGSLKTNQDLAVKEENYLMANQYQHEINEIQLQIKSLTQSRVNVNDVEKKTDSETLLKCLKIARGHLKSNKFSYISCSFRPLCDDIIQMLTNINEKVRCQALECYVLCCIVNKEMASKGIHVFYGSILANIDNDNYDIESLLISIKGVVDMLVLYGQDIITQWSADTNEGLQFSFTDIVKLLVNLMDDENVHVQECAGKGLCTLILNRRIFSPSLIARLILKWCHPGSEEDEGQRLRQTIGYTLQEIPTVLDCVDQLDDAFFITLQTLLNAPDTSPLAQVNVQNIVKFMLNLCSLCQSNVTLTHKTIAMKLVCAIQDNPDNPHITILSKVLLMLDGSSWDELTQRELGKLCNGAIEINTSRAVLSNISKFQKQLNNFKRMPEE